MPFKTIQLKRLIVNPSNDRHGDVGSEQDAIRWLLENKSAEMRRLTKDIASNRAVFDAQLVKTEGSFFVVYDGNRRTTCLKLLSDPSLAPIEWQTFFLAEQESLKGHSIDSVECQVEEDQDRVDKILERRHNGSQDGVGQIKWDTRAKAIHADRVGGKTDYPLAERIEEYLELIGYPYAKQIKRSNLQKLIDSKARRNRVGAYLDADNQLNFSKPKEDVSKTLIQIAEDLRSGTLSLKQLLLTRDKNEYLDKLGTKFGLNTTEGPKGTGPASATGNSKRTKRKSSQVKSGDRATLIPQKDYEISWRAGQQKLEDLWEQLQYHLAFKSHTLSIAVVLRVFLEQVATASFAAYDISDAGKLSKNLMKLSEKMRELDVYDSKQNEDIKRLLSDQKSLTGIEALQRVLHSKSHVPSQNDLIAMWDCLEPLTLALVKRQGL
jgi:hypothetical protein